MGYGKTYKTQWLEDLSGNQGNAGQVLSTTSTGISWVDASTLPGAGIWVASGNDIYNSNSGNVGIGTSSPTNYTNFTTLAIGNSLQGGVLEFQYSGLQAARIAATSANTLQFATNNVEAMRITSSGNVGIGTTSPSYKLTAYGSSTNSEIVASFGSANDQNEYTAIGLSGFITSNGATKAGLALKRSDIYGTGELHFLNNNTLDDSDMTLSDSKMMINSLGNVGIGTTSPASNYKLNVQGGIISKGTAPALELYETDSSNQRWILGGYGGLFAVRDVTGGTYPFQIEPAAPNDSIRIDSTGNVGIGTTSPNAKLQVYDALSSQIKITNGLATPVDLQLFASSSSYAGIGTASDHKLAIRTNGTEKVTVLSNGNVGIGTTSPNRKLVVSNGGASGIEIEPNYVAGVNEILSFNRTPGATAYETMRFNGGDFQFQTGGAERVRIDSSGNVGIGTVSPLNKLHISTSADVVTLFQSTDSVSKIEFADNNTTGSVRPSIGASGNNTIFTQGAAERMRIDSSGNVGIGTTSPNHRLTVNGDFGVGNSNKVYIGGAGADAVIGYLGNTSGKLTMNSDGSRDVIIGSGTVSDALFIKGTTGNVGIGTTSPSEKLEVDGKIKVTSTSDASIILQETGEEEYEIRAAGSGLFFKNDGDNQFALGQSGDVVFYKTDGSAGLTHKGSSGAVGIGTTNPSLNSVLTINETGGKGIEFQKNTAFKGRISTDGVSSGLVYEVPSGSNQMFLVGNDEKLRINYLGNVGIGATSPTGKLQIYKGGQSAYQTYTDTKEGLILQSYQSQGAPYTKTSDIVAGSDSTVPSEIRLLTRTAGQSSVDERMRINSSGNVGIGTTSPATSALLDVASTTKGVLLPRMNTTQINAISSPAEGLTVYNTVLSTLCFFNGVSWQKVTSTAM